MLKSICTRALFLSLLLASCTIAFAQIQADSSQLSSSDTSSVGNGNTRLAPAWQKIGNTGLSTQNWWIQLDRAGNMYVSSNNPTAGGVSRSTDKGFHWTVINTGFTCHLHRGMGLAPDGTVFVGNDYCTTFAEGNNHFYWLDNVNGSGTVWNMVATPSSIGNGGAINESVIANDGKTIVSTTYSGIWLSTNNARSWFLSPGSPFQGTKGVAEGMDTHKQPDGTIYAGFAHGGVYYSKDNGYHFARLGYPPTNPGNTNGAGGDIWAMATAPAGLVGGYLMVGVGNSGNNGAGSGIWCYGPQAPPNGHWVNCGNNDFMGLGNVDFTRIVVNPGKTRAIAIAYGDRGRPVIYSDDGVNWIACISGLPPDPSTNSGGANTQGMNVDPATGYVYIVLKNGDIYRTTQPQ